MKSVLISINPKWCKLIASGKKTVEVRKTRPKLETPFKCYIYCTNSKKDFLQSRNNVLFYCENRDFIGGHGCGLYKRLNGKVIGEFVCDRVQPFESEFVDDDCYESVASLDYDEDGDTTGFIEWSNDSDFSYESTGFYKKCCVKYEELKKYMGLGINDFYGWHISDLVIYDEPRELNEFITVDREAIKQCEHRERAYQNPDYTNGAWLFGGYVCNKGEIDWCCDCKRKPLKKPPQSWCYVERSET